METRVAPTEVTRSAIASVHAQSELFGLIKQKAVMSAACWRAWIRLASPEGVSPATLLLEENMVVDTDQQTQCDHFGAALQKR